MGYVRIRVVVCPCDSSTGLSESLTPTLKRAPRVVELRARARGGLAFTMMVPKFHLCFRTGFSKVLFFRCCLFFLFLILF